MPTDRLSALCSTSNLGSALPDYGSQYGGLAAGLTIPGTAFLWSNGTMSNLGGVPAGYANINAFGINASGTIVGNATDILGNDYAFVYSGGSWQALGGNMYTANGINDDGVIVGQTSGSGAYVLSGGVGGTQMNIGGMGAAYAINNSGVVVGGANNPINPNGGNAPQYYNGSLTFLQQQRTVRRTCIFMPRRSPATTAPRRSTTWLIVRIP